MSMMNMMLAAGGAGDVEFDIDFLVIAGGGGGGDTTDNTAGGNTTIYHMGGGGGAGGYLNSYGTDPSGGNSSTLATLNIITGTNFTVTVGAGGAVNSNGSDSVFSGTDTSSTAFSKTATGGGRGAGGTNNDSASTGGSGGGGGWVYANSKGTNYSSAQYDGQAGTSNQGTAGGDWAGSITPHNTFLCSILLDNYWCFDSGTSTFCAGGGGGAGSAGQDGSVNNVSSTEAGGDGGNGLASSITGSSVTRAGGGGGEYNSSRGNGTHGSGGTGYLEAGGGGQYRSAGQNGTVILRYPNTVTISFNSAQLTGTTATVGNDKVTTFTAGSGTVSWS
tara:strand:- start:3247 stop:4242 length:996 start_codon:yes stop_codon:yes gene_type:complete